MKRIDFSQVWRYVKNALPFFRKERSGFLIWICANDVDETSVLKFESALISTGFQFNYFSYTERGQLSNMRKLYTQGMNNEVIRQVHIRLFADGSVHAHDELAYEYDAIGHRSAKTLREIEHIDKIDIIDALSEELL